MKGHEKIMQMRKEGVSPKIVFLNDYECDTDWYETGDFATVSVAKNDVPEMLDLRYLVGLTVTISASTEKRAMALFEEAKKAGAKTVGSSHVYLVGRVGKAGWTGIYHG